MRIVVFGAGNIGVKLISENLNGVVRDEIVLVVDNDSKKWGTTIYRGYVVDDPQKILESDFDYIVIASIYEKEIREQLLQYSYSHRILSLADYQRNWYSRCRYYERYKNSDIVNKSVFTDDIVVYTSITGDYDDLKDPLYISPRIQYICFTNNKNIQSNKWHIEYINDDSLNNMLLAKKVKMFPHRYLPENITSVWIDGKFQVTEDLTEYIKKFEKTMPILCFPHFARNCIYDEAARCVTDGIGKKKEIIHQISAYERDNYPFDNGLYEMGCIVRNHSDATVKVLMEDWWNEVSKYSHRDQISFPYICWKHHFLPDICDQDLYRNQWLLFTKHKATE